MLIISKFLLSVIYTFLVLSIIAASSLVDALSVTFNNGSSLTLQNSFFDNTFKQLQQTGISGTFDWELSLVTPDTFNGLCPAAFYLAQGGKCEQVTFKTAGSATPNSDESGVKIIFTTTDGLQRTWTATVNVICDPSRDKLFSPSNSYAASMPTSESIAADFTFTSKGACLGAGPAPGPGNNGGDDDKKSGGLTWGGVFLIIFFVPSGIYVIGFVAWNYKQGMTGKDLAPHPEFWGSLPGLCKDGVTFLWSKIRGTEWTPSEAGSSGGVGASESAAGAGASGGYAAV